MRPRDIPRRAAITVVALVLLASAVIGRESPPAPQPVSMRQSPEPQAQTQDVDVQRLLRQRNGREATDLFARHSWAPPAPPTPPAPPVAIDPPAPPQAPALPFKYLGRMVKPDATLVYLLKGEEMFVVEAGTTLADYRVDAISESEISFVYLPLGTKQALTAATAQ